MSKTFAVKDYITVREHERMLDRAFSREEPEIFDPGREGLIGNVSSKFESHERRMQELMICKDVVRGIFSGADKTHRSRYDIAHAYVSVRNLKKLSESFSVAARFGSGLIIPLAGLIDGMSRRLDVTPDMVGNLMPDAFLRPDQISNFDVEDDVFIPPKDKAAHAKRAVESLDRMMMAAFGVNARPPEPDAALGHNPPDLGLSRTVVETAVQIASSIGHPVYDSDRAAIFLQNARRLYPRHFSDVKPFLSNQVQRLVQQSVALDARAKMLSELAR